MRLTWILAAVALIAVSGCNSGDNNNTEECGPGGTCPSGFMCDLVNNRCIRSTGVDAGIVADARADAGAPDAGTPDAATPDAAVAPDTMIVTGPPASGTATMVTFTFTSDRAGATFECRVGNAAFAACTTPHSLTLTPGSYTFEVRASAGGLTDSTPASRSFTIEAALDTTITGQPAAATRSREATLSFTANRAGATFECRLDDEAFAACTSPKVYTALEDGEHHFEVRAVLGDETDATPATAEWTIDTSGLVAVILTGAEGGISGADVTFTYMASDPQATFECGLDGTFVACDADGTTFTGLEHGSTHTFFVRARIGDDVGTPDSREFTVDAQAPVVVITAPMPGTTITGDVTVTFTVSEPAELTCTLNGNPQSPCESGMVLDLADDEYTLVITAEDPAGNVGTAMTIFTVDTSGPTVTITSPTDGEVVASRGTIVLSGSEDVDHVVCTVDGPPADCALPGFGYELANGSHTVTAQGFDAAGNGGPVDTVIFTVDAAAPVVTSIVASELPGTVTFTATLTDLSAIVSMRCRLDGGTFQNCASGSNTASITYNDLEQGEHLFEIFAIDAFGNSGLAGTSEPAPDTFARLLIDHSFGPGHLVLMGYDFANDNQVDALGAVLVNAVTQAVATGFERGVRVLLVTDDVSNEGETEELMVSAILGNALFRDDLPENYWLQTTNTDNFDQDFDGQDVIVFLDQNGAPNLQAIGKNLVSTLQGYLEDDSGIVVVLEGTFEDGDFLSASNTHQIIYPSLLDVRGSFDTGACLEIPCNDQDPILEGIDVDESFCVFDDHLTAFDTPEPWVSLADVNGRFDQISVMHKWFGETTEGPVGLSVFDTSSLGNVDLQLPPWEVFFQESGGAELAVCNTLTNSTAVYHVEGSGFVSPALQFNGSDSMMFTFTGAEPLDWLKLFPPFPASRNSNQIEVQLPGNLAGADHYRVFTDCGEMSTTNADAPVDLSVCADPVYNIIGEALGPNGEILAYTMENGRDEADSQTVDLPDWKDPLFATYDTGALDDVSETFLGASLFGDDFVWIEGSSGGDFNLSRRTAAPGDPIAFYSDEGNADPLYTALERAEGVIFNQDEDGGVAESFRRIGGDLVSTNVDVNLGATGVLLPRLGRPTLSFTGDPEHVRLAWSADGSLNVADGGYSLLIWLRGEVEAEGQHVWGIIHAPGTSVNAPPALDDRFWPRNDPSDFIIPFWVQIEDASFLTGYDDYRLAMRFGGVLRPFGQLPYTTRHTRYFTFLGAPAIIDASIGKLKLGGR